jgi:pimeloyl-ACP methyl ester carboxylesterase
MPPSPPAESPVAHTVELPPLRVARLGSLQVRYRDVGAGEPALLFVHGWGGSAEFWRENYPAFAPEQRVLLVDLPGHGASDVPPGDCTLGLFSAALAAVLRTAGVGRAVLIGHSLGTAVCCRFLRDHPGAVQALVTVDGALFGYEVTPEQRDTFLRQFRGADYRAAVAKFIRALFRQRCDPTLRERVCEDILRTPQAVLVSAFAGLLDAATWEPATIPVPLLMLNAPSPLWSEAYLARVRGLAPQLDYHVVAGAGHFLMLEKPSEFNTALAGFLQRLAVVTRNGDCHPPAP